MGNNSQFDAMCWIGKYTPKRSENAATKLNATKTQSTQSTKIFLLRRDNVLKKLKLKLISDRLVKVQNTTSYTNRVDSGSGKPRNTLPDCLQLSKFES
jgi:hypothetical protein